MKRLPCRKLAFENLDARIMLTATGADPSPDSHPFALATAVVPAGDHVLALATDAVAPATELVAQAAAPVVTRTRPVSTIDLTHWKLTLPTGPKDNPTEILAPALSQNYEDPPYFTNTLPGLYFFAPVTGVTTSGSSYARSELRESNPDGSLFNWHDTDFRLDQLTATLKVDQLPSTGKLVIGQIHGVENGQPLIKLQVDNGKLEALTRTTPTGSSVNHPLLGSDGKPIVVAIGQKFTYRLEITNSADGTTQDLNVYINGQEAYTQTLDKSWQGINLYFKAGAYTQDNSGPATEGGAATFTALDLNHTDDV